MFSLRLICRDTFRRVIRNKTTEQFSCLPYIYALLNCLICLWYGTPLISPRNTMVMTVNSIGAVFQLVYIMLFITYAEKGKKVVINLSIICTGLCLYEWWESVKAERSNLLKYSLHVVTDKNVRIVAWNIWPFHSYCYWELTNSWPLFATECCRDFELCFSRINVRLSLVYYCKSIFKLLFYLLLLDVFKGLPTFLVFLPLQFSLMCSQNLVIRTKSVEFMPFYLSLSTFLMSISFFLYGLFNYDLFVYVSIILPISVVHCAFTPFIMWRKCFSCHTSGPKWDRNSVGECSIGVVLLLQSSC